MKGNLVFNYMQLSPENANIYQLVPSLATGITLCVHEELDRDSCRTQAAASNGSSDFPAPPIWPGSSCDEEELRGPASSL